MSTRGLLTDSDQDLAKEKARSAVSPPATRLEIAGDELGMALSWDIFVTNLMRCIHRQIQNTLSGAVTVSTRRQSLQRPSSPNFSLILNSK